MQGECSTSSHQKDPYARTRDPAELSHQGLNSNHGLRGGLRLHESKKEQIVSEFTIGNSESNPEPEGMTSVDHYMIAEENRLLKQ